jgi:hypothetical protein
MRRRSHETSTVLLATTIMLRKGVEKAAILSKFEHAGVWERNIIYKSGNEIRRERIEKTYIQRMNHLRLGELV